MLIDVAMELAEEIVAALSPLAGRCQYAGSLRRSRETIGDVDILATADDSGSADGGVLAAAARRRGDRAWREEDLDPYRPRASRSTCGSSARGAWGAALQYFTGAKAHNVRTREIAVRAGLKLSEYGLFEVESGDLVVSATEEEVYERLGLPWVPPTLREDGGEIDAALKGELPRLVQLGDLRGDLHSHTDLTDGIALAGGHGRRRGARTASTTSRSPTTRPTCSCSG